MTGLTGSSPSSIVPTINPTILKQINFSEPPQIALPGIQESSILNTIFGELGFQPLPFGEINQLEQNIASTQKQISTIEAKLAGKSVEGFTTNSGLFIPSKGKLTGKKKKQALADLQLLKQSLDRQQFEFGELIPQDFRIQKTQAQLDREASEITGFTDQIASLESQLATGGKKGKPLRGKAKKNVLNQLNAAKKSLEQAKTAQGKIRFSGQLPKTPEQLEKEKVTKEEEKKFSGVRENIQETLLGKLGISPEGTPTELTPDELKEKQEQEDERRLFKDIQQSILSELGFKPGSTERERTETEIKREQAENLALDRQLAALRGELPVSPGLLRDLAEQETTLREQLTRQLGGGFETSTPGIEALSEFNLRRNEVLENARRGDIAFAGQVADQAGITASNLLSQKFNRLFATPSLGLERDQFNLAKLVAEANIANQEFNQLFQIPSFGLPREQFNLGENLSEIGILGGQQGLLAGERPANAQLISQFINNQISQLSALAQAQIAGTVVDPGSPGLLSSLGGLAGASAISNIPFDKVFSALPAFFGAPPIPFPTSIAA